MSLYDKSSIIQNSYDLWGIAVTSDILSLRDGLSFMSFHFTTHQLPSAIRSSPSVRIVLLASSDCPLWFGPFCIASSICAIIQSCQQSRSRPYIVIVV